MFKVDLLNVMKFDTRDEMGMRAAEAIVSKIKEVLKEKNECRMIFAAAPSQKDMMRYLRQSDVEWGKIVAFHLDEYIGLPDNAKQSFVYYLREELFDKVPFKRVNLLTVSESTIENDIANYEKLLIEAPIDIICLGIGENGHIAFNDPHVADFNDPKLVKIVELDQVCRQQQVNDGCFQNIDLVPRKAVTLTIPALMNGKYLFCVVPNANKAKAVKAMLENDISTDCPASILRKHDNCTLFVDENSFSLVQRK